MNSFVAFSGGIDSTALALLCPDSSPIFTDTGDEFDEVYAHIDAFEHRTGRNVIRLQGGMLLPEYVVTAKFLPNHGARFCTRMFKIEPMNTFLAKHLPAELLIGLRADEPADERVGNLTEMEGLTIRYPLREQGMGRLECVRLCIKHGLLPRYPPYMARGGCKGCFYKRTSEVVAMVHLIPDTIDDLIMREEAVQDERGKFFHMFPNAGKSVREIKDAVDSQQLMFSLDEIYGDASDSTDKGANCGLFCHR